MKNGFKITARLKNRIKERLEKRLTKTNYNNDADELFNRILNEIIFRLILFPKDGYTEKQSGAYAWEIVKSKIVDYKKDLSKHGRYFVDKKTSKFQKKEDVKVPDTLVYNFEDLHKSKDPENADQMLISKIQILNDDVGYRAVDQDTPERVLEFKELKQKAEEEIELLPEAQREVMKLFYKGHKKNEIGKEISEKLGISIEAVYTNLSRARENLKMFKKCNTKEFWEK